MRIIRANNPAIRKYFLNGEELQVVQTSTYLEIQIKNITRRNTEAEHAAVKALREISK